MGKESAYDAGDTRDAGLIPGLGRSLWGGNGKPLQYSCLRNARDRGTWWIIQSTGSQRVGHDSTEHTEGIESKEGQIDHLAHFLSQNFLKFFSFI